MAIGDIRTNKIPNFWSILNLLTFPLLYLLLPEHYAIDLDTIIYPLAFLLIGFILFLLKIMGAGDVKFISTFFLLIPNEKKEALFTLLLVSTIIIGGFIFLTNLIRNFNEINRALRINDVKAVKMYFGTKFSYAPVILMAWLWMGWNLKEKFLY